MFKKFNFFVTYWTFFVIFILVVYVMCFEKFSHIPVLLDEVLRELEVKEDGIYVDCTVGGASHSLAIAKKLKNGKIFAFDKDPDAFEVSKKRLKNYNAIIFNKDFKDLEETLKQNKISYVDGVLMDLGVSSFQLDNKNRGFSYKKTGPLDMRMNKCGLSAQNILNERSEKEIFYILKNYGEEPYAKKIAQKIVEKRQKQKIETTTDFAEIIKSCIPFKFRRRKNPCKKSFQAIRIAVNDELNSLKIGLNAAFNILKPKGKLLVISFHSLEDKIVKHFYKNKSTGCICPKDFPICVCGKKAKANIIYKKPIRPSSTEISKNIRAHSAKLRVLEKL